MAAAKKNTNSLVDAGWLAEGPYKTSFTNANGVFQDGVLAVCRDCKGVLWGLFGHENLGGVTLWKGETMNTMHRVCRIRYNFRLGPAGEAFNGSSYPDGPRSRGLLWPVGLWIDPDSGRFHCFIHNETGWGAGDTSYTAFGQQEGEPDFRHIGMMTSDDEGQSWDFAGWIITSNSPCWTNRWLPEGMTGGQQGDHICLGAGDFCLFTDDGYFYIFYTQMTYDMMSKNCKDMIFAARAPIASCGMPGSWMKLYNSSYSEPGNMGRETPVIMNGNVPCVSYNTCLQSYIMTSYNRECWMKGIGACQIAMSSDLVRWTEPLLLDPSRAALSKPYFTIYGDNEVNHSQTGRKFSIFMESNGTDVERMDITIP